MKNAIALSDQSAGYLRHLRNLRIGIFVILCPARFRCAFRHSGMVTTTPSFTSIRKPAWASFDQRPVSSACFTAHR